MKATASIAIRTQRVIHRPSRSVKPTPDRMKNAMYLGVKRISSKTGGSLSSYLLSSVSDLTTASFGHKYTIHTDFVNNNR